MKGTDSTLTCIFHDLFVTDHNNWETKDTSTVSKQSRNSKEQTEETKENNYERLTLPGIIYVGP